MGFRGPKALHQQTDQHCSPQSLGGDQWPAFIESRNLEDKVIVEIKSVELLASVHKQLLTYLRVAGKRLGLLINFHLALIKYGITRIVNSLQDDHAKQLTREALGETEMN